MGCIAGPKRDVSYGHLSEPLYFSTVFFNIVGSYFRYYIISNWNTISSPGLP